MNRAQNPDANFEQRLLVQLRAVVAERDAAEASRIAGASVTAPAWWRPNPRLALAGAGALAAIVAAILLVSSGPSAEPAAAEVLRQTAAVAAVAEGPSGIPGPGQFLYMKTKRVELQEWAPDSYTASYGGIAFPPGSASAESQKRAFGAFIPWQEEMWASSDELARHRWAMGTPRFLSSAEQSRWEKAGSPLPAPFGGKGESRGFPGSRIIEARPGVMDVEGQSGAGFRDFTALPTEPEALRLTIESRQEPGTPNYDGSTAKPLDTGQVIAELWDILDKPNGTPELRAAVFGALAELPGIELDRSALDLVGRSGYALSYESREPSEYQLDGIRIEYVFDPETSEILGRREVIADPKKIQGMEGISAGTVRREVAYLQSGIVDSTDEKPASTM